MQDIPAFTDGVFVPYVLRRHDAVAQRFDVYAALGRAHVRRATAHPDDAHAARVRHRGGGDEQRGQELGEEEVRDAIRAELEVEALGGETALRGHHDACVVEEHVEALLLG
ncbi:hypothetical protein HBI91_237990 [Parastagonospora nodorum]|nr:hypothetical protein HBI91_237990 [Parastagonospora nodorum]KAH5922369.1 hypothetical protein HBI87_228680 [Parastagonospora nodorum]